MEIVEDYEVSEVVAYEERIIVGEKVVSTERSISSSHDDTVVRSVSENVLFEEGACSDAAELSRAQYETLTRAEVDARATASHGSTSSTTETKKPVFDRKCRLVLCGVFSCCTSKDSHSNVFIFLSFST